MATISSKTLFLTTSPRTAEKMIPEIALLVARFKGQPWNKETQTAFMEVLREENFFAGRGAEDPAFSARDRINRAPKSLGFVSLNDGIALTPLGEALVSGTLTSEALLRGMLKFQIPSPYHRPTKEAAEFSIKPYLEMLRLVYELGTLRFDELRIFGLQLTRWQDFPIIIEKIQHFRKERTAHEGNYRAFREAVLKEELLSIYADRICKGDIKTRESEEKTLAKFVDTQRSNLRDYADALCRYLRSTGLVAISTVGRSLSIVPERMEDVRFILENTPREPYMASDETDYLRYLGDATTPLLYTDNRENLLDRFVTDFPHASISPEMPIVQLKAIYAEQVEKRKAEEIAQQVRSLKGYHHYDEVQALFEDIKESTRCKQLLDAPLMLEWNTWRAMTMIDGGDIRANLKFDDFGHPLSTAAGNQPDILCDYGDYLLAVEVTLASGQRQYETECEPVARHVGHLKRSTAKPVYGFFIAPKINEATIAHFYMLHHTSISYYGGKSIIVPLELHRFQKMLEDSFQASSQPSPQRVQAFFERSASIARIAKDETEWYTLLQAAALAWLEV